MATWKESMRAAYYESLADISDGSLAGLTAFLREAWEIESAIQIEEEARRAKRGRRSDLTKRLLSAGLRNSSNSYDRIMKRGLHQ